MDHFKLDHNKFAYRVFFALYVSAVMVAVTFMLVAGPREQRLEIVALALVGMGSWTAIEYAIHRFVLHGLQPFRRWHAGHHHRPTVLIRGSMILSAMLITMLVILPVLLLGDMWHGCALTLGLLTGHQGYAITHQAIHHLHSDNAWLKERKRWHVLYHHHGAQPCCYGVTSAFWDHVFGSTHRAIAPADH